jgi:sRNA-binding protein
MARKPYKEKVIYDPYNLSAVVEKFKAEDKAERKKQRIAKSVATRKQNRIKKQKDDLKKNQQQLKKVSKKLDKATVTGPLGGEIKVKTLKKISGGAPGLDRGPRSKMFIGKKFSDGGSMSKDKPKANAKAYTESSRPFLGIKAGSTDDKKIVYGGRRYTREEALVLQKKMKKSGDPILMDEAVNKLQRYINRHDAAKKAVAEEKQKKKEERKIQRKKDYGGAKPIGAGVYGKGPLGKNFIGKKMNMGGVMKNRGGTFKGIY